MRLRNRYAAVLVWFLALLQACPGVALAQDGPPLPTPQQLDQLLAPVALYPDTLLAQITTASTNPQEILDCNAWLQQNPGLGAGASPAAQAQGFDPAFVALASFPQVLAMMAQNIDDFAAIGQAFAADQSSVMDSIQRLRAQAYASGALANSDQQQVITQYDGTQQIIIIQPANPQVVYVPQYDPTVVYAGPSPGAVFLSFGVGIAIGALLVDRPWGWHGWGWNWGRRSVIVNHNTWVVNNNFYRPPRPTYRPRPPQYQGRPGFGGNWGRPGGGGQRPGGPPPGGGWQRPGGPPAPGGNNGPRPGGPAPGGGWQRPGGPPAPGGGNGPRPGQPGPGPAPSPPITPMPRPRPMPAPQPQPQPRPMPAPQPRPAPGGGNPYAGFAPRPGAQANRPAPPPQQQQARPGGFNVDAGGRDARAASARGAQSLDNGRRH